MSAENLEDPENPNNQFYDLDMVFTTASIYESRSPFFGTISI